MRDDRIHAGVDISRPINPLLGSIAPIPDQTNR
jgi:hypothetical protein